MNRIPGLRRPKRYSESGQYIKEALSADAGVSIKYVEKYHKQK